MSVNVVVPYDPGWPTEFADLSQRLTAALRGLDHTVEHVGSTAVPGLWAKPVIDIDIVVPNECLVGRAIDALVNTGYQHEGDLGVVGREAFQNPPQWRYHHLYLVVAGSALHRDHIDFRDFLRSHPDEAEHYAQLKQSLADYLATDRSRYFDGKRNRIEQLLIQARDNR